VLIGKTKQADVTLSVCQRARLEHHSTASHLDDRERVRVTVRIDADDVVQLICEHPDRPPAQLGGQVPVPVWGVEPRAAEL